MKKIFILAIAIMIPVFMSAQCPYHLTVYNDVYEELANPISVNNGEIWDGNSSYAIFLDFKIPIYGDSVGSINFNPGYGFNFPTFGYYHMYIFHWPFGGPLLLDRGYDSTASLSPLDYEVNGDPGDRILKLQWTNAGFEQDMIPNSYNTVTNEDSTNFQVWFYEQDGRIEFHFGPRQVLNPDSWGHWNGGITGPFTKFIIGDYMLDIFGNANNPSYQWISNVGIVYGGMLNGIPDEGIVYGLDPDFSVSLNDISMKRNVIDVLWDPGTSRLIIQNGNAYCNYGCIQLYNLSGQIMYHQEFSNAPQEISLQNLPGGLYMARITIDDQMITKKFVK